MFNNKNLSDNSKVTQFYKVKAEPKLKNEIKNKAQ